MGGKANLHTIIFHHAGRFGTETDPIVSLIRKSEAGSDET